ncbi:TIGR00730 family Rossman fold protein [Micromonospora sp. NPDC049900]|uniref:TIGR00730 family Rossman fold protein n=1 Tax=Micromonospora sp. NPDC049900 TaxID=3364275 RepID=UPI0037AFF1CA
MHYITVFCGASTGWRRVHLEAATAFATTLARAGLGLVYGGASTGLMGAIADTALAAGAPVIGIIPQSLVRHEVAHRGLTELHIVESMHERKAMMADLGDAFVALPGGFGTADEFFEALTWSQLGLHTKPCAMLDTDGFYTPLLHFLRTAVDEGFVQGRYLDNLIVARDAEELLPRLASHVALPGLFHQEPHAATARAA